MTSFSLSGIENFDCVPIVTDHSTHDYKDILKRAKLVVDTRNATQGIVPTISFAADSFLAKRKTSTLRLTGANRCFFCSPAIFVFKL